MVVCKHLNLHVLNVTTQDRIPFFPRLAFICRPDALRQLLPFKNLRALQID